MKPKKPILKYIVSIVIVIAIAIGAVLIVQGKSASQDASVYKTTTSKAATTQVSVPTGGNPLPCLAGVTTPKVHVISPNGGEMFTPGQQITVKWDTCNIPSNAQIQIGMQWPGSWGTLPGFTVVNTVNSGTKTITLPQVNFFSAGGFQYGQYYKIVVTAPNNTVGGIGAFDVSDNFFAINAVPAAGITVTLVSTNFTAGSATVNNTGVFNIKFRVDAGGNTPIYVASQAWGGGAGGYPINTTAHAIDRSGTATTGGVSMILTNITDYSLDTGSGLNKIDPGIPETFDLSVSATVPSSGSAGLYRLLMTGLKWGTDPNDPTPNNLYTLPQPFSTGYFVIN